MSQVEKKNTISTTASDLILVKVDRGSWSAEEGTHEHSEGWANSAYYAVHGAVLASDYDAGGGSIGLLILAVDQDDTVRELNGQGFCASASPLNPRQGKSRFGDSHGGTVDVWRDGDDVLVVEGTQPLG